MIDAAQIRAARALMNMSQADLAEIATLHVATVRRLEASAEIRGSAETVWKIQTALEKAGVEFIPADEMKGPGVRLKQVPEPPRRVRTRRSGTKS
jgi:transcriptional regulator with XRE-family HTH domain